MANDKDLCKSADVKSWLGIDIQDTSQDASISRLITSTSKDFMNRVRRPGLFPISTYTELREIVNRQSESRLVDVFLDNYPVRAVTSVTLNEQQVAEYDPAIPDQLGWVFDRTLSDELRQKITLRGGGGINWQTWMSPRRSVYRGSPLRVVTTYSGGYDEVPEDISQAIIEWVAFKLSLGKLQSKDPTSQSLYIGTYRQDTMTANSMIKATSVDMPEGTHRVINIYQRPVV